MNFRCNCMPAGFLFLTLCLAHFGYGQTIIEPEWSKVLEENPGGKAQGWGVDLDDDGNVYWAPSLDSTGAGFDIYAFKFDSDGNPLWINPLHFGGAGAQQAYVCNAKADHLYIGGKFCLISGTDCDMQLVKASKSDGSIEWTRTYDFGNAGYDEIDGLEIRSDGIYCGGWAQAIQTGFQQIDLGLWKLDFDGNTEWTSYFGSAGVSDHQDGHMVVDDNFIYTAGLYGGTGLLNGFNGHAFLGKFDRTNGALVDSVLFGHQSSMFLDAENALGMTTDGTHLYITGYTTLPGSTNWQIFVAKYDKSLNEEWIIDWGGSGTETARGIVVANDRIYIAGLTESVEYSVGAQDALLLELDLDGNYIKHATYGDALNNAFHDIAVSNNAIYLSGTNFEVGDASGVAAFLLKVDDGITGIDPDKAQLVQLYPNPASGLLYFDSALSAKFVRVFNTSGLLLYEGTPAGNFIDLSSFNPGAYFLNLELENGETLRGNFKVVR